MIVLEDRFEWRERGRTAPKPRGGDRKSSRIEAHGDFLLGRIKDVPDITLEKLREQLRGERGLEVSIGALWRFFDRHQVTFLGQDESQSPRSPVDGETRQGGIIECLFMAECVEEVLVRLERS